MSNFVSYSERVGALPDKQFKATLFQSARLMLGLNCLEPGQSQHAHTHGDQDKFYFVVEGSGRFEVGDETRDASEGMVVWAPATVTHGVTNTGTKRLVLLVGIAPFSGR
ncbi:MAG TPA: cupin domain-containing protein [Vicinamibacterales bacterium]|jgi:mannose-6-phosphate isomerase-like protein (cupin superfamily)